ncbi:MAG: sulfatase family protein [Aestuariibaculum sp.]
MKKYIIGIFTVIVGLCFFGSCVKGKTEKQVIGKNKEYPNIVLILADDLGYGDVGIYNKNAKLKTPNIDKLAEDGIRYTDAHSPSSVCTPTRYGILTGRYAWRTKLKKGVLLPWDMPLIEKERITLPTLLKQNGYRTAAIGKWHLGWNWSTKDSLTAKAGDGLNVDYTKDITGGPLAVGFDYYFGDDVPNFPPYTFIENRRVIKAPTVLKPKEIFGRTGMMATDWKLEKVMPTLTEKSVAYIKEASQKSQPFFLYLPLTAPHTPIAPTDNFKGTSNAGLYGDFVQEVDWTVGEVLKAIKETGIDDNTIVIFTSDNGSPARNGEDYSGPIASVITDYGHYANGALKGLKSDTWEGGHRIPFIIKWNDQLKKGQEKKALISSLDIMATLSEILDIDLPDNSSPDGKSFLATTREDNNVGRKILVHHSGGGIFAIRSGDWKLIQSNKSGGFSDFINKDGYGIETKGQLYHIKDDFSETTNLYNEHPEIVESLQAKLDSIRVLNY